MCIRPQVMGVLKSMVGSIDLRAPMLVIKYATFKEHGCIPRSSDEKTVPLSELPADIKVRRLFFPLDGDHDVLAATESVSLGWKVNDEAQVLDSFRDVGFKVWGSGADLGQFSGFRV